MENIIDKLYKMRKPLLDDYWKNENENREGYNKAINEVIKLLERSDNSDYAKCPLCKGTGTMPKADESNDVDINDDDL